MRQKLVSPDQIISRIAARQHGVITLGQLVEAGLSPSGISRRVAAGRLHRVYRGVYAVGHAGLSNEGRWMAAVLACGEGALLSHRSAAELWGLLQPCSSPIHVTVPGAGGRAKRQGLVFHRPPSLISAAIASRKGIAVTTPARTLADLRRSESAGVVRRAERAASFKGLEIADEGGHGGERSELERRFLRLCSLRKVPKPEVNYPVGPYTVDFVWPFDRLAAETDGWAAHRGRQAFEDDRARDLFLRSQGYEVLRFTWRQITEDPASVTEILRRYLY